MSETLSSLKPNPSNPRNIEPKQLEMLKKSLEKFGDLSGLIVNRVSGNIVSGHQRYKVLPPDAEIVIEKRFDQPTKYGTVATGHILIDGERFAYREVSVDDVTEKAMNLAANQHGGEFDLRAVADWIMELDHASVDLDLIGFTNEELANIMAPVHPLNAQSDEDDAGELKQEDSRIVLGDLWILGNHRLLCGDSTQITDFDRVLQGDKVKLFFTDPPYGVNMTAKNKLLNAATGQSSLTSGIQGDDLSIKELEPIIRSVFTNMGTALDKKSSYYVCSPQGGELGLMMMMMQESGIICRHMCVWVKNAPVFSMGRLDYDYQHEPILYGWPAGESHEFFGKGEFTKSVWHVDREPNKLHPTMKPIRLVENAILNSTLSGWVTMDPFGGSGSTLIASEKHGRKCRTIEISPAYCAVILDRWAKFTGKDPVREDGIKWSELANN